MTGSSVGRIVVEPNQQPLNKGMQWLISFRDEEDDDDDDVDMHG
jgi:hypothetical protein